MGEPTMDAVLGWMSSLSNWGRWGATDVLGTLNFITDEVRRAAAREVRSGTAVSCAWEIEATSWPDGMPSRYMHSAGEGASDPVGSKAHVHVAADVLELAVHGLQSTHLDALSHWSVDGRMYNGRDASRVTSMDGATELGVETVPDGITTRGMLLDVAAANGVDAFCPGQGVYPEDLERAEQRQGVRVRSGDALLVYTGYEVARGRTALDYSRDSTPGLSAACLPWLHEREVAVIGSEFSHEVKPNGYAVIDESPIHTIGITAMGLWLIDGCSLRPLATACADRDQWAFLFTVGALRVRGATGSPVNPIALL